jgi:hypothetical protein
MKLTQLIIIALCFSVVISSEKKARKIHKSHNHGDLLPTPINERMEKMEYEPKHISETFYGGNPNTLPQDRHFLWKDYHRNQFIRPFMHGVVGPMWKIPAGDAQGAYKHIASPMPKPDWSGRIVPTYLPPNTHSHTSWDLPKRQDVMQAELPYSTTHTRELYQDPRFPAKKPVAIVTGSLYHGTGSTDAEINKGNNMVPTAANPQTANSEFVFLQKKNKNIRSHNKKHKAKAHKKHRQLPPPGGKILKSEEAEKIRTGGINEAQAAEKRSSKMLDALTPSPEGSTDGRMTLGVDVLNKREPHVKLHQDNGRLKVLEDHWRTRGPGLKVMNGKPFLPKP